MSAKIHKRIILLSQLLRFLQKCRVSTRLLYCKRNKHPLDIPRKIRNACAYSNADAPQDLQAYAQNHEGADRAHHVCGDIKRIAKPPLFVREAGTRAARCGTFSATVSPALARRSLSNRIVSAHSLDGNRPHREGTVARYFMGTVEKPEGDTFMGLPHLLSFSLRK